jgi:hypothetical protein
MATRMGYWGAYIIILAGLIWSGAKVLSTAWDDLRGVREQALWRAHDAAGPGHVG